jgi:hypothetical protein
MWVCPTYGKLLDDVSSGLVIYRLIRASRRRRRGLVKVLVKVLVRVAVILTHRAYSITMYCVLYMRAFYEQTRHAAPVENRRTRPRTSPASADRVAAEGGGQRVRTPHHHALLSPFPHTYIHYTGYETYRRQGIDGRP